ncbi:MAG: hypothetical protein GZ088_00170 [Acidipila sp.]|nr:hypothetical protein [Acidipila sp.]
MTEQERWELATLLEERTLSNFERRRRRFNAASQSASFATAITKARKKLPLTVDEYVLSHVGFLPGEKLPPRKKL